MTGSAIVPIVDGMVSSRTPSRIPTPSLRRRSPAQIWDVKYRLKAPDGTPVERTRRRHLGARGRGRGGREQGGKRVSANAGRSAFHEAMADFAFLPAGRILAGAGTGRDVTLFNCFVMGRSRTTSARSSTTSRKPR